MLDKKRASTYSYESSFGFLILCLHSLMMEVRRGWFVCRIWCYNWKLSFDGEQILTYFSAKTWRWRGWQYRTWCRDYQWCKYCCFCFLFFIMSMEQYNITSWGIKIQCLICYMHFWRHVLSQTWKSLKPDQYIQNYYFICNTSLSASWNTSAFCNISEMLLSAFLWKMSHAQNLKLFNTW